MNIETVSKIAQDTLAKIVNGEVSNSNAKNTINALGKVLAAELAKIKYQQHTGKKKEISFFEEQE